MIGWGWVYIICGSLFLFSVYSVLKDIWKAGSMREKRNLVITWAVVFIIGAGIFIGIKLSPVPEMLYGKTPMIQETVPLEDILHGEGQYQEE